METKRVLVTRVCEDGSKCAVFCEDMKCANHLYPDLEKREVSTTTVCDVKNVPVDHKRYIVAYYNGISSLYNNWGYVFVWDYDTLEEAKKNQHVMCSVFDTCKK